MELESKILEILPNVPENTIVYPRKESIFKALDRPLASTKVVILGQDPYHGPGQATGLAFAVNNDMARPPSLRNIFKELSDDMKFTPSSFQSDLTGWADQGVLLLNCALTVEEGRPGSHMGLWEEFTNTIIYLLDESPKVFILWGKFAQSKESLLTPDRHAILKAAHPSPLSVRGFYGCSHFSKTNQILVEQFKMTPIDWSKISSKKP